MVVAPRYGEYAEGWETGVRRQMRIFGGDQEVSCWHGCISQLLLVRLIALKLAMAQHSATVEKFDTAKLGVTDQTC